MRRKEKEILEQAALEKIIQQAQVCRLGMIDGDQPYVVPLNFGYADGTVYVHGALQGRKVQVLQRNPKVCVEFDINTALVQAVDPCSWGVHYQSVIGFGQAVFIESLSEKALALAIIMRHYSDQYYQFPEKALTATAVIKIRLDIMTGKQSGFKKD